MKWVCGEEKSNKVKKTSNSREQIASATKYIIVCEIRNQNICKTALEIILINFLSACRLQFTCVN